jgi:hypothetical protein
VADIEVQPKKRGIWAWVVGLIVLAFLIWAIAEMFDGDDDVVEEPGAVDVGVLEEPEPPSALLTAVRA